MKNAGDSEIFSLLKPISLAAALRTDDGAVVLRIDQFYGIGLEQIFNQKSSSQFRIVHT
ncbi:MAG: hypothetical protein ONB46_17350 [candidate division KSB1 bacterium]|nr:hypothetical protein [candidate division KSB1 bacterium]MDZ7367629.1 hypothetical protein [candidate division KSB1 bacterium]